MKIYTKTGDDGTTGLFGGMRVRKDDLRVEAYGTVDELNALLGVVRSGGLPTEVDAVLAQVQPELFVLGAELACTPGKEGKLSIEPIGGIAIERLEQAIDAAEATLSPLTSFILPGGSAAAAALHLGRTLCRRAERATIAARTSGEVRETLVVYLNRLSDLLFVLARQCNRVASIPDVPWNPRVSG